MRRATTKAQLKAAGAASRARAAARAVADEEERTKWTTGAGIDIELSRARPAPTLQFRPQVASRRGWLEAEAVAYEIAAALLRIVGDQDLRAEVIVGGTMETVVHLRSVGVVDEVLASCLRAATESFFGRHGREVKS